MAQRGISDKQRQWLARLVTTRRLVLVPSGLFPNRREEEAIDPNRDFPYDLRDPRLCMRTIAGRTLNEVFREHMFQLSLTFHGGTEVIGYEWGAPTYLNQWSPDDTAQAEIASAYSRYAGSFGTTRQYDVGTMNDKVYYVRGGMEDWAYAGSWDPARVIQCQPTTYDNYPKEKTVYNNATLRVFNMLIETSHQKIPSQSKLGTSESVLDKDTNGNGHISRNIRLALSAHDLVEPYASVVGVNDLALSDDIIPLTNRSCEENDKAIKKVMIPKNLAQVTVEWTVGGALTIHNTTLWYAKSTDIPSGTLDCLEQPSADAIRAHFKEGKVHGAVNGTGYLSPLGAQPHPSVSATDVEPSLGPLFTASIDVNDLKQGDKLTVIASARVDQSWTRPANGVIGPNVGPQAHVVNVRTNPDWFFESNGKHIHGRLDWFSIPIQIVVGDYSDSIGNQAGKEISTIEVSNRFGRTTGNTHGGISPSKPKSKSLLTWQELAIGVVVFCCAVAMGLVARRRGASEHRELVASYDQEGTSSAFEGKIELQKFDDNGEVYEDEPDTTHSIS
eukprot:CAMPEP_0116569836 /NCGR_PEP_ID=MMETSP0397-20121206/16568_1 /TAXON_ID=216820 /ORGANISM="Cyclophora tenuis, Strain ECT3854" /LENGTH=557 /DNA_ID=CAMNT_0004097551 /DNA_START=29 /DNA_END=1703 /DNA_ORIENTATION=-